MTTRDTAQRHQDTLAALRQESDLWVASADETGEAHLIPLAYLWDGERLTMATRQTSKTARNLARAGRARLALPATHDVVIVEGPVELIPIDADDDLAVAHTAATGFDARAQSEVYVYIRLTPERMQAWRDVAELTGRTIMREGRWRDN